MLLISKSESFVKLTTMILTTNVDLTWIAVLSVNQLSINHGRRGFALLLTYTKLPIGGAISPMTRWHLIQQWSEIGYWDRTELDNTVSSHLKINRQRQVSEEHSTLNIYVNIYFSNSFVCIQVKNKTTCCNTTKQHLIICILGMVMVCVCVCMWGRGGVIQSTSETKKIWIKIGDNSSKA